VLGAWEELRERVALPVELVGWSCAYAAGLYAFGIATAVMEGLGDFKPRNLLQLLPPLVVVVGCGVASWRGERWGAAQLVGVYVTGYAVASLLGVSALRRRTRVALTTAWPRGWRRDYLRFGLTSAHGMVAANLNARVDTLLVANLAGAEQTGLYA